MQKFLDHNKTIHFIGIGGSGMYPLAMIAKQSGFKISGTDQAQNSKHVKSLREEGITVYSEHKYENIQPNSYVVHSTAIKDDNPELVAASENACSILHRSQLLALLSHGKHLIAVSGTHGKTTTSSLIAHILKHAGLNPTAVIGGELLNYQSSFLYGDGPYFIIEADESDGSLLNYRPFISVVNNIDLDHLDYYKGIDHIQDTFLEFIQSTEQDGAVVLNWDDPRCFEIGHRLDGDRLVFGKRIGSDIRLLNWQFKQNQLTLSLVVERQKILITSSLLGEHSVMNGLAAISVAHALELDLDKVKEAFASFAGVKRRLEKIIESEQYRVTIYDDYAHNPGKVDSALSALRTAYPDHRIIAIFQPHRYSRIEKLYNEFIASFTCCDQLLLAPVYAAGESNNNDFSLESFAKDLAYKIQKPVNLIDSEQDIAFLLRENSTNTPRVMITLGAGDVSKYAHRLRDYIHETEDDVQTDTSTSAP